ncbi:hypothetical protein LINGRAHAP2_LOCUS16108 [Linum grandiflorum]
MANPIPLQPLINFWCTIVKSPPSPSGGDNDSGSGFNPEQLAYLNARFERLEEKITAGGGIIDKFFSYGEKAAKVLNLIQIVVDLYNTYKA